MPKRLDYKDLMAIIARCKRPWSRKPRNKHRMPTRAADPWPVTRTQELRLYREIWLCWKELAVVKGKLAVANIDLRAARRNGKTEKALPGRGLCICAHDREVHALQSVFFGEPERTLCGGSWCRCKLYREEVRKK